MGDNLVINPFHQTNTVTRDSGFYVSYVNFKLPPFLLASYWHRHDLSYLDVNKIFSHTPSQYCWMAAILYGMDISISAVTVSYACIYDVLISSKSIAMKKIIHSNNAYFSDVNTITQQVFTHHIPSLPVHNIDQNTFKTLLTILVPDICILTVKPISAMYKWKNHMWLPIKIQGNYIMCTMCFPENEYTNVFGNVANLTYSKKPYIVRMGDKPYVLSSESVIFSSE